jgi:hypothetical protein
MWPRHGVDGQFPMASTVNYHIYEFGVNGTTKLPSPAFTTTVPSLGSQVTAVTFPATDSRFIMYTNTDSKTQKHGIYYVNSTDKART